jgi:hypothetical protein
MTALRHGSYDYEEYEHWNVAQTAFKLMNHLGDVLDPLQALILAEWASNVDSGHCLVGSHYKGITTEKMLEKAKTATSVNGVCSIETVIRDVRTKAIDLIQNNNYNGLKEMIKEIII